ncbi:MAG: energy transducer TonB [Deltaproteobacteria bacterium]|nr:energy transducer TonB [Deltaproteobacteria bacterium]
MEDRKEDRKEAFQLERERRRRAFVFWFALSLLLHAILFVIPQKWMASPPRKQSPPIEVRRIQIPKEARQIVEAPDDQKSPEPPKDARYLSKHDRQVEKETKAPLTGKPENRKFAPPQPQTRVPQPKEPSQTPSPSAKKPLPSLADLTLPSLNKPTPAKERTPSTTDDYLPEVETGKETLLNSREFVFYSYYERIKSRLRMFWTPSLRNEVNRLYAKGVALESGDYMTAVHVTLDRNGEILDVDLLQSSGYRELDHVAIDAFKKAAPFPNPPRGMIDADGRVRLRWNFILQHNKGWGLEVFLSRQ